MFIQTENTPNPATLKFLPGQNVMGEGAVADFPSAEQAARSPLARALFQVPDVSRVFFGSDFISITKRDGDWKHLKPALLGVIMEHFTRGLPLIEGAAEEVDENHYGEGGDPDVIAQIKELIDTRVRPAVAQDGGDIIFRGFEEGVVYLHMQGSCSGCPSSTATLKMGIENMLKHYVPEVVAVEAVP
jgi:Fe-S cluster biogenesis protein NfuA